MKATYKAAQYYLNPLIRLDINCDHFNSPGEIRIVSHHNL